MSRANKRIVWGLTVVVGIALAIALVGPFLPYKEVINLICPITGSTRTEIEWCGYFKREEQKVSKLETWLRRKESAFQPSWRHLSTQTYFVLGRACATGGKPEICSLVPILDEVVEKVREEKISRLVAVLRQGSREEQREMIQHISDEVFEQLRR